MSDFYLAAAASSSHVQPIINNALKAYKKRTKNDLLTHPLFSQLEACKTPAAIHAVLQQQVQGFDQSPDCDDRCIKWLDPTVDVIYPLSDKLGEDVSLVSLQTLTCPNYALTHIYGRYSHPRNQYLSELVSFSQCASWISMPGQYTNAYI